MLYPLLPCGRQEREKQQCWALNQVQTYKSFWFNNYKASRLLCHFPSQAGTNHEEERGDVCSCEMLAEVEGSTAKSEMTEAEGLTR